VGNAVGICSDGGAEGIMGGDGGLVVGLDVETEEGTAIGSGDVAVEGVFGIKRWVGLSVAHDAFSEGVACDVANLGIAKNFNAETIEPRYKNSL
jgi:hypothetical protein